MNIFMHIHIYKIILSSWPPETIGCKVVLEMGLALQVSLYLCVLFLVFSGDEMRFRV